MIICPNCKEEIDDDSHYCDQCGQMLLFCDSCGRVGAGKRCIYCGGQMSPAGAVAADVAEEPRQEAIPVLTLANTRQGIRFTAADGAVIGRKTGVYKHFFDNNMYVSGQHAQFVYSHSDGWGIIDKDSSNGTFINRNRLQPGRFAALRNGDVLTIAVLDLQVNIV